MNCPKCSGAMMKEKDREDEMLWRWSCVNCGTTVREPKEILPKPRKRAKRKGK